MSTTTSSQEPSHKAYVLLLSAVDKTAISDFALRVEQAEIVEQCLRVLSALFDYARQSEQGRLLESCILLQRALTIRMWEHIGPSRSIFELCRLIAPAVVPRFVENGIASIGDVMQLSAKDLQHILRCSNEDVHNVLRFGCTMSASQLVASAKVLQKHQLEVTIVPARTAASSLSVPVSTHRQRVDDFPYEYHAQDFTSHSFHMICWHAESYRLLAYRKFSSTRTTMTFTINLSDSSVQGAAQVQISLICVDMAGLDYCGNYGNASPAALGEGEGLRHAVVSATSSPNEDSPSPQSSSSSPAVGIDAGATMAPGRKCEENRLGRDGDYDGYYGYEDGESQADSQDKYHHNNHASHGSTMVQQKLKSSYFQSPPPSTNLTNDTKGSSNSSSKKKKPLRHSRVANKKSARVSAAAGSNQIGSAAHAAAPGATRGRGASQKTRGNKSSVTGRMLPVGSGNGTTGNSRKGGSGAGGERRQGVDFGMFEYKSFRERRSLEQQQERGMYATQEGYTPTTTRSHQSLPASHFSPAPRYSRFTGTGTAAGDMTNVQNGSDLSPAPPYSPTFARNGQQRAELDVPAPILSSSDIRSDPTVGCGDGDRNGVVCVGDSSNISTISNDLNRLRRKAEEVQTAQSYPIKKYRSRLHTAPGQVAATAVTESTKINPHDEVGCSESMNSDEALAMPLHPHEGLSHPAVATGTYTSQYSLNVPQPPPMLTGMLPSMQASRSSGNITQGYQVFQPQQRFPDFQTSQVSSISHPAAPAPPGTNGNSFWNVTPLLHSMNGGVPGGSGAGQAQGQPVERQHLLPWNHRTASNTFDTGHTCIGSIESSGNGGIMVTRSQAPTSYGLTFPDRTEASTMLSKQPREGTTIANHARPAMLHAPVSISAPSMAVNAAATTGGSACRHQLPRHFMRHPEQRLVVSAPPSHSPVAGEGDKCPDRTNTKSSSRNPNLGSFIEKSPTDNSLQQQVDAASIKASGLLGNEMDSISGGDVGSCAVDLFEKGFL